MKRYSCDKICDHISPMERCAIMTQASPHSPHSLGFIGRLHSRKVKVPMEVMIHQQASRTTLQGQPIFSDYQNESAPTSATCRMDGVCGQKTLFHCIPIPVVMINFVPTTNHPHASIYPVVTDHLTHLSTFLPMIFTHFHRQLVVTQLHLKAIGSHLDRLKEIRFQVSRWMTTGSHLDHLKEIRFQVSRWMTTGSHLDHLKEIHFQVSRWMTTGSHLDHLKAIRFQSSRWMTTGSHLDHLKAMGFQFNRWMTTGSHLDHWRRNGLGKGDHEKYQA